MLLSVLAMLGMLSLFAAVLASMTIAALRTSAAFGDALDATSAADSALDLVVSDLQQNPAAAGQECFGAADLGGGHSTAYQRTIRFPDPSGGADVELDVVIDCVEQNSPPTSERDVSLVAFVDGAPDPSGKARVLITDEVGGLSRPGSELRICDWQLGQNIRSSLASC